jgi:hypothetical protein
MFWIFLDLCEHSGSSWISSPFLQNWESLTALLTDDLPRGLVLLLDVVPGLCSGLAVLGWPCPNVLILDLLCGIVSSDSMHFLNSFPLPFEKIDLILKLIDQGAVLRQGF